MTNFFLAINWPQVGLQVGQLILSLSILVVLHEFGHYITAKWFKCRVEKFYLFFNPWFSLFKKKIGETEYGVGWLPLGGYVKIAGMIDESMDKDQLKLPPQPWEFRSKPAWQRLIIMIGGVTVNVILAFLIYAMILMVWGEKKVDNNSLKYGIAVEDSLMLKNGFRDGDKITKVGSKVMNNYLDIVPNLILSREVTVLRNGKEQIISLPENFIGNLVEKRRRDIPLISIRTPLWVGNTPDTGKAALSGVQRWDKVVKVDTVATPFMNQATNELYKNRNKTVNVTVQRGDSLLQTTWVLDSTGYMSGLKIIGKPESLDSAGVIDYSVKKYGFFPAFPAGVRTAYMKLVWYVEQFKLILNPKTEAYKGVGGFKAMGSIFNKYEWDWEQFWNITAFLSIVLAFMNLLPIPALDGGHVLFTLYEMVTGQKPSDKFLEYAQIVGMVILFALMIYANGNDWFGWGRGK